MSFSKTISVVAALASIFGAGAAGWKLSQESQVKPAEDVTTKYENQITELRQQVDTLQKQTTNVNPPPAVVLPQPQPQVQQQVAPAPTPLPYTQSPPPPAPTKPFE